MFQKSLDINPEGIAPDAITAEIAEINYEFLHLLIHPDAHDARPLLGLGSGVLTALELLEPEELRRIAGVPLLLAEFSPFPGFAEVRDDARLGLLPSRQESPWFAELNQFANRLLTCIWQTSRRDPMMTSLLMGVSRATACQLAAFGFSSISQYSVQAGNLLQVRMGRHPRFWADLVRLVRTGSDYQQAVSRLALIPLSVTENSGRAPVVADQLYAHPRR